MATLDDIKAALIAGNAGSGTPGADWFVFTGYMPDSDELGSGGQKAVPDRAISIYEYPGEAPMENQTLTFPRFQVTARGKPDDYQATRAQMDLIIGVLHAGEENIGEVYVYCLQLHSGVINRGFDTQRRPLLAANFKTAKKSL